MWEKVSKILNAIYDGKSFWPERTIDLSPDTRVRLIIDIVEESEKKNSSFLQTARNLNIDGPTDWSSKFKDYLYGDKRP